MFYRRSTIGGAVRRTIAERSQNDRRTALICVSTRGKAPAVSLKEAILAGLAPDGGLYVPQSIPRKPDSWWSALRGKSFHDIAIAVAIELADGEFDHATLTNLVRDAVNFPVRIVELEKGLGVLELF